MRVLHVLEAMGGGTKKHVQLLIAGLVERGVEAVLAVPYPRPFEAKSALMDYSFPDAMRSQGIWVEEFHITHGRITPVGDIRALGELVRYLKRDRFDVVHTHSAKAGVLGRIAAHLAGVPVVVHTPYSLPFRRELNQGARYWLYYFIEKMLGRWTDVMIATSKAEYREISASGIIDAEQIPLIHNCLDLENYAYQYDCRAASKRDLGWAENQLVVGTVARISPQKGIQTLLESARLVREQIPNVRFVVVGEGELRGEIEQRAQALGLNGTWTMVGQRDDYLRYLRAFDVFAFPSLWEGLPYAPIEAMAVGTPVVATSVVGTIDLVSHEETGLLVPARDETSMAQAIVRVLTDASLARQLAVRGRSFIETNFNAERPVEQTLDAYRQALEAKRLRGKAK
jgi:glycosyltransferase involved in cell wall biosynthesis